MDLLLIHPGTPRPDHITEHLGISSLKAFINAHHFKADTLDLAIEALSLAEVVERILYIQPRLLGISLLEATQRRGFSIIKAVRAAGFNSPIIIGGYFATFSATDILKDFPEVDVAVRGEGELTLLELMQTLLNKRKKDLSGIQGITYRCKNQIIENPARPLIDNLDILPPVDRKYAPNILAQKGRLRLSATRGCWGQCSFCDIIGMYGISSGKIWRRRSTKQVVDEIEHLVRNYGTNYFIFNDDQFLLKGKKAREIVEEFARELEKRQLRIKFELMCRADTIDRIVMRRLKTIGLTRVFLGIESFEKKQLKRFNKKISVRQNLKALITLYQLKIDVIASVILADAYTTLWDLLKQFIIIFELRHRYFNSPNCQISVNRKLEVYPGSLVYHEYKRKNILTKDHYLTGYDYKLKFWTSLRLGIFRFEEGFSRILFNPGAIIREINMKLRQQISFQKGPVAWE